MSMEVVLGVDPGISNTGWAVVDGSGAVIRSGVVRTYARWEMADRITHIFDTISTVVDTVQPGLAVVEGFSFRGGGKSAMAQFVKSAVVTGAATGAIISACSGVETEIVAPHVWRRRIGAQGGGRDRKARKEFGRQAVERKVNGALSPKTPDHVIDAIGLALFGLEV